MEIYLMVLLPISSVFLFCMFIMLLVFERGKRQTLEMISEGYFFFKKDDTFIGIPPECMQNGGLATVIQNLTQSDTQI